MDISPNPVPQLVKAILPRYQALAASSSQVHLPLLCVMFPMCQARKSHVRVDGEGGEESNQSVPWPPSRQPLSGRTWNAQSSILSAHGIGKDHLNEKKKAILFARAMQSDPLLVFEGKGKALSWTEGTRCILVKVAILGMEAGSLEVGVLCD